MKTWMLLGLAGAAAGGVWYYRKHGKLPIPPIPGFGAPTIQGQDYFNSLDSGRRSAVIAALFSWYQGAKGQWPATIQDPGLTAAKDLDDPGNFSLTVDGYQTVNGDAGSPGVFDSTVLGGLLPS